MLSAVSSRVRNIFGSHSYITEPRKRSLEEESEEEEGSGDGEGEPARKKSRPLIDDNETPVARSYIWNLRKFVSGSVSGVYSWMSHLTSPSRSRGGKVNSTDTGVHKIRIKMTGSTNSSKREKGRAEGATTAGESTGESNPITSGIERTSGMIADDDEVQFLGVTSPSGQNDQPTKRPALIRRSIAQELSEPSLSPINSNFRFKPTISPVASEATPNVTPRLPTNEPTFLRNSLAGRKVYSNPRKSGSSTRIPTKSLHERYFGIHKKKQISPLFLSGRGSSCAQESFRFEDKMRYRQLLQQYTDSSVLPSSHIRKMSPGSFSTCNSCSTAPISPIGLITRSRLNSIWTREKRQQLEVTLNSLASSSEPLTGATSLRLQEPTSEKKVVDLSVVDIERTESNSSIQSAKDSETESVIFVGEVTKPTSKRNSLEEQLLESPVYSSNWLKDLREKYEVRAKTNDTEVEILAEMQKKYEERRKVCQSSLEDRVTRRMKYLDLTFPSKVEEITPEEEIEEEEFIQLTSDIEDVIDDALEKTPAGEVLVDKFSIKITRRDIATLAGLNWLNDEVINFYMNLLMERGKNDNYPSVYAFNTFFYPKLVKSGYQSVQRWTKKEEDLDKGVTDHGNRKRKFFSQREQSSWSHMNEFLAVDVFSYEILLVPVHLEMHWCLATIDFKNRSIQYYDSMLGNNDRCLEALLEYLQSEHLNKKHSDYTSSDWTLENVKDIPQQMNGSDCGMFACKFAEYLSRRAHITFKQQHMPYFRRRMVYEIVRAKLL